MRTKSTLVVATGFAALALAATGSLDAARAQTDPAPATATPSTTTPAHAHHKSMHHKPMYPHDKHGHLAPTAKGNAAVEDLNNQSLNAAKSGTTFTPTASSTTAESGMSNATPMKGMHHHHGHGMMPSSASKPADSTSSAMPSTSTPATPPADTAPTTAPTTTPPASTAPGAPPPQ